MINKQKNSKTGFTLMETLIAVFILTLAISGPMVLAQKGLQAALVSKDQDTAYYLAQDAIEYIRYARDTNCLAAGVSPCPTGATSPSWLKNTIDLTPCVSANGCTVDPISGLSSSPTAPASCGSICTPINYDSSHNYFTYGSGSASIFTRTITITSPACNGGTCNSSEAAISVSVSWNDPIAHSITVKENLLDWQ